MSMRTPVAVGILHHDRLFREAVAVALSRHEAISSTRTFASLDELWGAAGDGIPQVVVVHLCLPDRHGLEDVRQLSQAWPQARILMIGVGNLESDVVAACEAGASGCLPDDASFSEFVQHVEAVAVGETPCSPKIAGLLFARVRDGARELRRLRSLDMNHLTHRELEIIALIDEGLSNKEIAVRLRIEIQTVKNHVHNILEKLDLDGRRAAVRFARERGLLPIASRASNATRL